MQELIFLNPKITPAIPITGFERKQLTHISYFVSLSSIFAYNLTMNRLTNGTYKRLQIIEFYYQLFIIMVRLIHPMKWLFELL